MIIPVIFLKLTVIKILAAHSLRGSVGSIKSGSGKKSRIKELRLQGATLAFREGEDAEDFVNFSGSTASSSHILSGSIHLIAR
jgi:hypothetical protein